MRPIIDRAFPLDEAPAAIDALAAGRARGKFVIRVAGAR
ncbi:MAG: zinc-binding dehydrogenase [Pseudonocardia sp.]|nr:zinc-binding dehydrogenase [Pseudonocardia sp.]